MNCPVCGHHYTNPEEIEYIETYEMCSRCDNNGAVEEEYGEED